MPWPCGAADFVQQFARHLAAAGCRVTALTSNTKASSEESAYSTHVLPGGWNLRHVRQVARWLRQQDFDAIDFQYEAAMYGYSGKALLLPMFLRRRSCPLILTLHSQDLPRRGRRFWRLAQMVPYDAVVFYSEAFCARMHSWLPKRAATFHVQGFPANIQPVASPELAPLLGRLRAGWLQPAALLVYFGHINPSRGIEDVLEALLALRQRGLRPQLALVSQFDPAGNDYHRRMQHWVDANGLGDQVTFTGRLGSDRVSQFLQAANACVLPFPEGASFKNGSLAAAIAHAVPTVTTVSALTEKALLAGDALQTYRAGDRTALGGLLRDLVIDPARCADLRRRMRRLQHLVAWENYIDARVAIYESAAQKRAGLRGPQRCSASCAIKEKLTRPGAISALPAATPAAAGAAACSARFTP